MKKFILVFGFVLTAFFSMHSESILIPGDVNALCYYGNFFYNLPENDFVYYLNDGLLFNEPPDDEIYNEGLREPYLRLVRRHKQIKEYIAKNSKSGPSQLAINLKSRSEFDKAVFFLKLLGIDLSKNNDGTFLLKINENVGTIPFYSFYRLNIPNMQEQLNKSGIFFFKLVENNIQIPWSFQFINEISGLKVNSDTFFLNLLGNKKLSLLLAVLYRLSENEINFISRSLPQGNNLAWKQIYNDKKLLLGLFVLSNGLRVEENRLLLPGGNSTSSFWSGLAGFDVVSNPYDFLISLISKDDGKLNYLYVFSYYLPDENRKILLFNFDLEKMRQIYLQISLAENEKIASNAFPRLEFNSFYALLNTLQIKNNRLYFPLGISAWAKAMDMDFVSESDDYGFVQKFLETELKNGRKKSLLPKFVAIYSKFNDRSELLTPQALENIFQIYDKYNVLVDFVEKIPFKKSETLVALISWVKNLPANDEKKQMLFTAISQSLLEIISQTAWYAPDLFNYDLLVTKLTEIPFQESTFYDQIFAWIKSQSGLATDEDISDDSFFTFILGGLKNQTVKIQNEQYEWLPKDLFKSILKDIQLSQEVCSLSALNDINFILDSISLDSTPFSKNSIRRLTEAFEQLPYPDFSKDAPKKIKDRVMSYAKSDLDADLKKLIEKKEKNAGKEDILKAVAEIKGNYLLPHLKDYLVSLVYALNAKNSRLRLFSNPNLIRLHDFSESNGSSAWNTTSNAGNKLEFAGYYLKGGLSRLNITFSLNWRNQLFDKAIYSVEHAQAMIINIMAMLPQPLFNHSQEYASLLVEFAVELLQKSGSDETLKRDLRNVLKTQVAGYHYFKTCAFLSDPAIDYYLYFSELYKLGNAFFKSGKYLDIFSHREELEKFAKMPMSAVINAESESWGNISYSTFGTLRPHLHDDFPLETATLFRNSWIAGEMFDEFKIRTAFQAFKNNLPASLLGQFLFDYLQTVCKSIYSQNHVKDYASTYFIFDIMNKAHLKNTVKKLQKEGYLRLK